VCALRTGLPGRKRTLEQADLVSAIVLGVVESRVGVLQQLVRGFTVSREEGNADRDAEPIEALAWTAL
jgi:hypothetical protein